MHIRRINSIRPYLNEEAVETLIQSVVISRLDYCYCIFIGIPLSSIHRFELGHNAAARVVCKTPPRAHMTPILRQLHWLPVVKRCQFKLLTLTFKSLHGDTVSRAEVINVIHFLNNSSAGYDELPTFVVKLCVKSFIQPLTFLINFLLKSGVFPSELKLAKVVPIFKVGDSSDLTIYRPISVLTFSAKVFEKLFITKLWILLLKIMFFMITSMVFAKVVLLGKLSLLLLTGLLNLKT